MKARTVQEKRDSIKKLGQEYVENQQNNLKVSLWLLNKLVELSKQTALSPAFDNYIYYTHSNKVVINHYDHYEQMDAIEFEKLINSISKKDLTTLPKGICFVLTTYTTHTTS